jgi:hypothetical protein
MKLSTQMIVTLVLIANFYIASLGAAQSVLRDYEQEELSTRLPIARKHGSPRNFDSGAKQVAAKDVGGK